MISDRQQQHLFVGGRDILLRLASFIAEEQKEILLLPTKGYVLGVFFLQ